MEQAFFNARVVMRDTVAQGALLVRDGVVAGIDDGGGRIGEDLEGDILAPGIIDLHTDNLEKHFFPRPNIDWDAASAAIVHDGLCASVGVTTVYDSLSIGSYANAARTEDNQTRLIEGVAHAAAAGLLRIDHRFHWRCELSAGDMMSRLDPVVTHPLTGLLSLMDHTPGQRQYRNIEKFRKAWRAEGMDDTQIAEKLSAALVRQAENVGPNRARTAAIAQAMKIPLAAHDDETVAHIDDAADAGATIAEFPVTMEAAQHARARGMAVIMGGPNLIRGGSYSGNVAAREVAAQGLLDGFASDYVPRSLIECAIKLTQPPFNWDLSRAWATVSAVPAAALGLSDRGVLEAGRRGDLVRIRVMDGRPIVRGVWVAGRRVA